MTAKGWFSRAAIEQQVCDLTASVLGLSRDQLSPSDRMHEDLRIDSLDLIELFTDLEEAFAVTLSYPGQTPVTKAVFTRQPFRLSDLAELIYLQ